MVKELVSVLYLQLVTRHVINYKQLTQLTPLQITQGDKNHVQNSQTLYRR